MVGIGFLHFYLSELKNKSLILLHLFRSKKVIFETIYINYLWKILRNMFNVLL